jgi:tetraacyldisaccharide 4'-kinase
MRAAPRFWAEPPGILARLLVPVAAAWDTASWLREAVVRPYRAPAPVLCVGNLVAGGAGKTPVALALASHLMARGVTVHFVTRGYGGSLIGPVLVDRSGHDAVTVGDEALLLAKHAPVWVARDRAAGVRAAVAAGADIVLLDDGLQNPTVAKTLSILVVDAGYGFGNGRVIPAGPLRESLSRGLAKAHALVLLVAETETGSPAQIAIRSGLPVLPAGLVPIRGERLAGARLMAFAGIGRPEKFFATLQGLGAVLAGSHAFPDHHPFRDIEIEQLLREAEREGARLVTTAKDIVRVPQAYRCAIEVLEVEVRWRDPAALDEVIGPIAHSAMGHSLARSPLPAAVPHAGEGQLG